MHDFLRENPEDMLCELMAERAGYLKRQQKGVNEMCDISEEIREEGRKEGRTEGMFEGHAKGLAEGQALLIMNMFRNGMSIEQISSVTDMDKSEVKQLVNA